MTLRRLAGPLALLACCATVAACGTTDEPKETASGDSTPAATEAPKESKTGEQSKFFVQADYDRQLAQRSVTPEGDASKPWTQMIEPEMVDTAKYKSDKSSGWNVCFSNAVIEHAARLPMMHSTEIVNELMKNVPKLSGSPCHPLI